MTDTELEVMPDGGGNRSLHFEWVLPLFFNPRRTLKQVVQQEKPVWLVPLLILTVMVLMSVLAAMPARRLAAQNGTELPADYQYYTTDQQAQYQQTQQLRQGAVFTLLFPAAGALAGVWIGWFLTGSILHLALTLSGSRSSNLAVLNLVGWASLPFALRFLVQALAALFSHQVIRAAGLSGFIAAGGGGFVSLMRALLSVVDIYLIWQVVLLLIGVSPLASSATAKARIAVLVTLLLILSLQALPGFLVTRFSGMQVTRLFF
jgi:hypothetical protein